MDRLIAVINHAVRSGGTWLEGFDTLLPAVYGRFGFRPVAKLRFNPEFAPEGWPYEHYQKFNAGKPDVVFFQYDGQPRSPRVVKSLVDAVPYVDSYDIAAQMARPSGKLPP